MHSLQEAVLSCTLYSAGESTEYSTFIYSPGCLEAGVKVAGTERQV